jgi:thiamine pyrophosphate-dependent acetolactate synthase large subunit-like protein
MVRSAFKLAQTERPGAVYLAVPQDVEPMPAPSGAAPLKVNRVHSERPRRRRSRAQPPPSKLPNGQSCLPGMAPRGMALRTR